MSVFQVNDLIWKQNGQLESFEELVCSIRTGFHPRVHGHKLRSAGSARMYFAAFKFRSLGKAILNLVDRIAGNL